ncbi:ribonuclease P protein subunit p25-like protein [Lethenteron reissneri]|uniref:ribonuclease P protein subunit p25-like protein n=1 Tax=Lethenteron reissneri TaxID=7753 RepID=UPI002AB7078A|nr:ribonuclease P protein subunit p25-like protein [Lethenteron reissneri]
MGTRPWKLFNKEAACERESNSAPACPPPRGPPTARPPPPSSVMEFYERTRVEQLPTGLPFPWLPPDVPMVHVAEGSQERSVVTRVLRHLSDGDARHVLLSGAGRAGGRAVSCSDAVLRRAPGAPLRRAVSAGTRVTAETWEPRARGCGLDTLVVRRSAHTLTVLLTKDELPAGTGDLDLRSIDATIFFSEPKAPAGAGRAVDAAATAAAAEQGRGHVPSSPLCSCFSGVCPEMPPLFALDRPP